MLNRGRGFIERITFVLQDSVFLLLLGLVLSFAYIEKVQNTLRSASGELTYHIGFIATQIYEVGEKHQYFNWGFPVFIVLGIMLLYFSILSKEEAKESALSTSVNEDDSNQQVCSAEDCD